MTIPKQLMVVIFNFLFSSKRSVQNDILHDPYVDKNRIEKIDIRNFLSKKYCTFTNNNFHETKLDR